MVFTYFWLATIPQRNDKKWIQAKKMLESIELISLIFRNFGKNQSISAEKTFLLLNKPL